MNGNYTITVTTGDVDEITSADAPVHFEILNDSEAMLRVGDRHFTVYATKDGLLKVRVLE